ncbi:MAG TPA: HAMP domain-containing sensor histidine kinase [Ruminiclostridium sp.]|nr:HAMP domain-containing sensor histidine kinase [Ruminiclostridium sp.]
MFITFILLWIISILLIYANPKECWAWCASTCLFFNGFGTVSLIISKYFIPYSFSMRNGTLISAGFIFKGISDVLQNYLALYSFVIFILFFTNFLNIQMKSILKKMIVALLFIPSLFMFLKYPISPVFRPDFSVLSLWALVFTLFSDIILIISIFRERDDYTRKQKILTAIFAVPSSLCILWTRYLSAALGFKGLWEYDGWVIVFEFILFILFCLKYGMLGIRLKIERMSIDNNIDSIIGGMSIVSHAIKNEVSTINLCVDTIMFVENTSPGMNKKLHIIKDSCKNLLEFTRKVSDMKLYKMNYKPCLISEILDKVINQVAPSILKKDITIFNNSKIDATMLIDPVHISEVLKNLLINAIEAIQTEGTITVNTELINNRKMCISVSDNGIGIPKESIDKVTAPFFSTKNGKNNFGLGLSYCFKVMKCHNGSLQIKSRENFGTEMSLLFPINKVIHVYNNELAESKR